MHHSEKTGSPANKIGNWLCEKDAIDSQSSDIGEKKSQRYDNDDLSKQRKENGVFGTPQRHKSGLSGKLERHHKKSEKVNRHGRYTQFQELRITVEQVDKGFRKNQLPARTR